MYIYMYLYIYAFVCMYWHCKITISVRGHSLNFSLTAACGHIPTLTEKWKVMNINGKCEKL